MEIKHWDRYYNEITEAKKEYDELLNPFVASLFAIRQQAWERYLKRIGNAEVFLKEQEGIFDNSSKIETLEFKVPEKKGVGRPEFHKIYPDTTQEQILKALKDSNWNQKEAGEALGLSRPTMHNRVRKLGGLRHLKEISTKEEA